QIVTNTVVRERDFLRQGLLDCPFFSLLPAEELQRIVDKVKIGLAPELPVTAAQLRRPGCPVRVFQPGEVILRRGQEVNEHSCFYLIRQGRVRVDFVTAAGQPGSKEKLRRDHFGDRALVLDQPRNATVTALERVETYVIGRDTFERFPDVQKKIDDFIEVYG